MNKRAIRCTSICSWSEEDQTFVVESPLFETIAGVGASEKQSRKVFENLLDDAYQAYLEGRVPRYDKPGRPTKGGVAMNVDVKPETKQLIKELADDFQCSQGEIIDFFAFAYQKRHESMISSVGKRTSKDESSRQLRAALKRMREKTHELEESIDYLEAEYPVVLLRQQSSRTQACKRVDTIRLHKTKAR